MRIKRAFWFNFFLFFCTTLSAYDHQLAVVAIFRDEARFLREWIEYHRLVGVERFYLYNHLSQDDCTSVLQPYIDQGIVVLEDVKSEPGNIFRWNALQVGAYNRTLKEVRGKVKWLAAIDIDEYILPIQPVKIPQILRAYEKHAGLAINWLCFGTSYIEHIPDDQLIIENLLLHAPRDYTHNQYVKLFVRPERVLGFVGPHTCGVSGDEKIVTIDGKSLNKKKSSTIIHEKIRINHYWTKDEDHLNNVKLKRKHMGRWLSVVTQAARVLNSESDTLITRYAPQLRDRMAL